MFTAKLNNVSIFKKIIESLKDLIKEINIEVGITGLSMKAKDSSNTALVSFELHESGFSEYRCQKKMTLGINIENFSKILKCANNDDNISIFLNVFK